MMRPPSFRAARQMPVRFRPRAPETKRATEQLPKFDQPFVSLTVNHVGLKAFAIGEVAYKNLLVFAQINQLSQIGRDRETAFVMQTRARHHGAMNLRFQNGQLHLTCRRSSPSPR